MHAAAIAITEHIALGTVVTAHPFSVAVNIKASLPYIHEVVSVDIALMIVGAYAGTGGDGAAAP